MCASEFNLVIRTYTFPDSPSVTVHAQSPVGYPGVAAMQRELMRRWIPYRKPRDYNRNPERRERIKNGIRVFRHTDHSGYQLYQVLTLERKSQ